ncbi:MAG: acyloxyacyl hydrolase [Bacteroidales bacterium]|nr:acyloxyacyl hydrolase [Bacteroidales bacterium]
MIIAHHPEMWALTDGFFPSWEFSLTKQTVGKNSWVYLRNYPRYGLSYRYSDFGHSIYLGEAHSVMPFISLQLLKTPKTLLDFRISLGAAYITRKFDRLENYKNRAISTHWNASVSFEVQGNWQLTEVTGLTAGLSMLHLSNGTIKTPNYGLNVPGVFAGLNFRLSRKPINYQIPDELILNKGKQNIRISAGIARKQLINHPDELFLVYSSEIAYARYYNNTNRFIIGADASYDQSNKIVLETQGDTTSNLTELSKFGLIAGHEWVFSRFALNFSIGYYLHNLNDSNDLVYNKLGVIYFFHKNIYAGITLKSHYAKADFFSVGMGLSF